MKPKKKIEVLELFKKVLTGTGMGQPESLGDVIENIDSEIASQELRIKTDTGGFGYRG